MGMAVSLFLIAVGAILTWAVTATTNGLDVNTVGVILMIVGLVGLFLSLAFWSSWGGPGFFHRSVVYTDGAAPAPRGYASRRRTTYVEEDPGAPAGPPL
jgi:hypothetical protein